MTDWLTEKLIDCYTGGKTSLTLKKWHVCSALEKLWISSGFFFFLSELRHKYPKDYCCSDYDLLVRSQVVHPYKAGRECRSARSQASLMQRHMLACKLTFWATPSQVHQGWLHSMAPAYTRFPLSTRLDCQSCWPPLAFLEGLILD